MGMCLFTIYDKVVGSARPEPFVHLCALRNFHSGVRTSTAALSGCSAGQKAMGACLIILYY